MNATLFLLTSTLLTAADPAPVAPMNPLPPAVTSAPAAPHAAPAPHAASSISGGAAASCDPCAEHAKPGLFSKLKGKLGSVKLFGKHEKEECCEEKHAPVVTMPAPTTITRSPAVYPHVMTGCDGCETGHAKPSLFGKLKGKFVKTGSIDAGCDSCAATPAPAAVPVAPVAPAPAAVPAPLGEPKKLPEPKTIPANEAPKKMPEKIGGVTTPVTPTITPTSTSPISVNRENPF